MNTINKHTRAGAEAGWFDKISSLTAPWAVIMTPFGAAGDWCWGTALPIPWWRHQMETFSALLALCAGNSPVTGEFPAQRPVTQGFHVFYDLRINSLRPRLNRRPFADDIFKCIFLNENEWISPRISLKCVPKVRINNTSRRQAIIWTSDG